MRSGILFFILVIFSLNLHGAGKLPEIILNDANEAPLTTIGHDGILDIIGKEAFRRAGVSLKLIRLPAERALIKANEGSIDGDFSRVVGIDQQYPNLVRVPEKFIDWDFCAFSKNKSIASTYEEIHKHSVGIIKGWKIYEKQFKGSSKMVSVEDSKHLFRALELDRIEVALFSCESGLQMIRDMKLLGVSTLEPPLHKREMYIYLNKAHVDLVPKIAKALRDLKAEGRYNSILSKIKNH